METERARIGCYTNFTVDCPLRITQLLSDPRLNVALGLRRH